MEHAFIKEESSISIYTIFKNCIYLMKIEINIYKFVLESVHQDLRVKDNPMDYRCM